MTTINSLKRASFVSLLFLSTLISAFAFQGPRHEFGFVNSTNHYRDSTKNNFAIRDSSRHHRFITSNKDSIRHQNDTSKWGDVTIDLENDHDSILLDSDFVCEGNLHLKKGVLKLNKHKLKIKGHFTADSGSIDCDSTSSIEVDGNDSIVKIRFAHGRKHLGKLKIHHCDTTVIEGDVVITDSVEVVNGILDISSASFDVKGSISMINSMMAGNHRTKFTMGGSNKRDTIRFAAGKDTLGTFKVDPSKFLLTLGSNLRVADSLFLNNTKLQIRNGVLSLDSSCVLKGFNRNSYVITGDSGSLQRRGRGNGKELDFPIGTINNFAPACITPTKGHDSIAYCVSAAYGVLAKGLTGDSLSATNPFVKTTWHVTCTADSFKMTLKLKWPKNLETPGFNRVRCFISHFEHQRWDSVPQTVCDSTTDSTLVSLTRTDIQTLSPFTVMSVKTPTSITELQQNNVVVFPNPATDFVRFNYSVADRLILLDITGRIKRNVALNRDNATVNVSDLPAGLYLYRLTNKGKVTATGKLAINK